MAHPFQKPLGWLSRFYYNVEHGHVPFPTPVIPIDQDWPLELQIQQANLATGAGGVTTLSYTPSEEKHALLVFADQQADISTPFPATDNVFLRLVSPIGILVDVVRTGGSAVNYFPLVGGALNGSSLQWFGIPPVYIPPRWTVEILHTSVAGGITTQSTFIFLERLRSYPLRLP